jgi:hypothetical protein
MNMYDHIYIFKRKVGFVSSTFEKCSRLRILHNCYKINR